MNAQIPFAALAVAGLLLVSPGGGVLAQQAPAVSTQSDVLAQEAPAVSTQSDAPEATVLASLTGASRNNVEVWRLRCTTTPLLFAQVARARIRDRGGNDGRRLYFHLKRQTTGATVKTTAPDGGLSGFVSVGSGGAGFCLLHRGVERSRRLGRARNPDCGTLHAPGRMFCGGDRTRINLGPDSESMTRVSESLHSFGDVEARFHTPV